MQKYKLYILLSIYCIIGLSIIYDACSCITIDLLEGEELEGLTNAEYLYLPVRSNL